MAPPRIARVEVPSATGDEAGVLAGLAPSLEKLAGVDLGKVKIRYNSNKPVALNALAYTEGNEIHIAPGAEKTIPHEAWHVVQQGQGRALVNG